MLLPKLADSLAGRMEIIRLSPLAQMEIQNYAPGPGFLDQLFSGKFSMTTYERLGNKLIKRVLGGGFPPVLARTSLKRRQAWQRQYMQALTLRDILDLAKIRSLEAVPKLLAVVAEQTATLFNVSKLASSFELSRPTIREYLTLLQHIFLVELLQPWSGNRLKRLVKTPKIHLADSGLAGALLGVDMTALQENRTLYGQLLESFVFQELRRQATWAERSLRFYHYRDKDKVEVDVVVEQEGKAICGVEVKAASSVRKTDFTGLRRLRENHEQFIRGVVLYDGDKILPFGDRLYAVPFAELWNLHS